MRFSEILGIDFRKNYIVKICSQTIFENFCHQNFDYFCVSRNSAILRLTVERATLAKVALGPSRNQQQETTMNRKQLTSLP